MLKLIAISSALAISGPVLAQQAPTTTRAAPSSQTTPGATTTAPAAPTNTPQAGQAANPAAPAAPQAGQQPVSKADQVAQVVDAEFGTYDKNSDGSLDATEFGAWMVALKSATDPSTKAGDPATQTWINGAFATADKDKSKTVSKDELTGFLALGA